MATTVVLEQLDYVYDEVLNIDTQTSSREGGAHNYSYDDLDRLTQATHPTLPQEDYEYDKVGNREVSDPALYDYDANHRITTSPTGITYAFDSDGNLETKVNGSTTETFAHNWNNRLTQYTDGTTIATYQYDPSGRRISKTVNGTTTYFVWDGKIIISEYNAAGTRTKRYAYLPNGLNPLQIEDINGVYDVHTDHLQTPQFLTNTAQQIVWSQSQEAFGKAIVSDNPDGDANSVTFNFRFVGQYYDQESGLHQNYFRDYDAELDRYIQSDPIGLLGGLNTYLYVNANPIVLTDFLGLAPCECDPDKPDDDGEENKECDGNDSSDDDSDPPPDPDMDDILDKLRDNASSKICPKHSSNLFQCNHCCRQGTNINDKNPCFIGCNDKFLFSEI